MQIYLLDYRENFEGVFPCIGVLHHVEKEESLLIKNPFWEEDPNERDMVWNLVLF